MTGGQEFPDLPGLDTVDGLRRMMNKAGLYEKILRDFYVRFIDEPRAIREAITSGDLAAAERHAHSAKGLAGTIGAPSLQNAAKALETVLRDGDASLEETLAQFEHELRMVLDSIANGFGIDRAD
ncbi:MAG: Hpt domain-containing protein [Betaproteobacteria bacterium]|nr:Hpt domain-containing protein [Betaproteobacteria bacterium]